MLALEARGKTLSSEHSRRRVIRHRSVHLHNELFELHEANKEKVIAEVPERPRQQKAFTESYINNLASSHGCTIQTLQYISNK